MPVSTRWMTLTRFAYAHMKKDRKAILTICINLCLKDSPPSTWQRHHPGSCWGLPSNDKERACSPTATAHTSASVMDSWHAQKCSPRPVLLETSQFMGYIGYVTLTGSNHRKRLMFKPCSNRTAALDMRLSKNPKVRIVATYLPHGGHSDEGVETATESHSVRRSCCCFSWWHRLSAVFYDDDANLYISAGGAATLLGRQRVRCCPMSLSVYAYDPGGMLCDWIYIHICVVFVMYTGL